MVIMNPSIEVFAELTARASNELIICSPFITDVPINSMDGWSPLDNATVKLWTRLSPSDWLSGISDPVAVWNVLDTAYSKGHEVQLCIHQRLHAKAYIADREYAILGSANLTRGGFGGNVEAVIELFGEAALELASKLEETLVTAKFLSLDDLRKWIERHETTIKEIGESSSVEANELAEVQRSLDELLGMNLDKESFKSVEEPTPEFMEQFISWLRLNQQLREAELVIKRYENYQNLSGKAKQSISAVFRFLRYNPGFVEELANSAVKQDGIFEPDVELQKMWRRHMDTFATHRGEGFDYAILRGYLTPNYGGTLSGGGGGESTLKRVLPLMAYYLREFDGT